MVYLLVFLCMLAGVFCGTVGTVLLLYHKEQRKQKKKNAGDDVK